MIGFFSKVAVWSVAMLLILQNLGVDVTALVAGLGIGGAAIALASQNILGDLFASLSIVLDKPFVLGDFIVVDQYMGTVEHIGLKTTRVRSLSGEQLIFSNGDLLKSRISNFKRMTERRVVFSLGVAYETPPEKLAAVAAMLREIVQAQKRVRFDRAPLQSVRRFRFALRSGLLRARSRLQRLHGYTAGDQPCRRRAIRPARRIEFAYPTQTIHLRQQPPPPS